MSKFIWSDLTIENQINVGHINFFPKSVSGDTEMVLDYLVKKMNLYFSLTEMCTQLQMSETKVNKIVKKLHTSGIIIHSPFDNRIIINWKVIASLI